MHSYINGAIKEAIGKGKALMQKIPGARELGLYFSPLATTANREIEGFIAELNHIYSDEGYNNVINIRQKFVQYKRISGELSHIENVVIAAMSRKATDDDFVNKLVHEICQEINYPLPTPVASCLSQKYYNIYPSYNLICIPLLESEFLLHLADIYHELGHPLVSLDNPKVEGFQKNLGYFNVTVKKHFEDEISRRELNKAAPDDFDPIHVYKESWLANWSIEFFCDLFAAYTLGPAYLWSNLHMCTSMSWDVYRIPTFQKISHPPDDARMKAIMFGLELIGFTDEVAEVKEKWEEFKMIIGAKKDSEFNIAVPDKLLRSAAEFCLVATKEIKCDIATKDMTKSVSNLLNSAWVEFWKDPENFAPWEKSALNDFRTNLR
ncbi:hypothetical protein [Pedobacter insulae]|uniref:Uncharacterized protein n=1 Tax=Pedobacter insulae TaxID=414048 RepID=A0A1I2ZH09_9SPHI|nr:hypothetical protein [Pedobacter insulae]SFH36955.1 hypothetical protein SAMN04489864_11014 [Pedobacter insulae]